jgi:hypothetical protein
MSDKWFYQHANAVHGPVSAEQMLDLVERGGLVRDDLSWPESIEAVAAIPAESALKFPTAAPAETAALPRSPKPAPDWLPELAQALAAVQDLTKLPPPRPEDWIADVRRAEQSARPAGK